MPLVRLKPTWPGEFHRTIRDEDGKAVETLYFTKDDVLDLDHRQMLALQGDLGNALEEVVLVDGKFRTAQWVRENPQSNAVSREAQKKEASTTAPAQNAGSEAVSSHRSRRERRQQHQPSEE